MNEKNKDEKLDKYAKDKILLEKALRNSLEKRYGLKPDSVDIEKYALMLLDKANNEKTND
ncbi:MAG: hypothetical protein IJW66_04835 [Clostridia bacterium]|nr:hypothetical protein [Clostridia bacterium]